MGISVARLAMALALSRSSRAIMHVSTTQMASLMAPSSSTSARACSESRILLTTVRVRFPAVRIGRLVGVMSIAAAPARNGPARSSNAHKINSKQFPKIHAPKPSMQRLFMPNQLKDRSRTLQAASCSARAPKEQPEIQLFLSGQVRRCPAPFAKVLSKDQKQRLGCGSVVHVRMPHSAVGHMIIFSLSVVRLWR